MSRPRHPNPASCSCADCIEWCGGGRRLAQSNVIDLEEARWVRLAKHPPAQYGSVELVDGQVRIDVQGDYTPAAAEAIARELYRLAGMARGEQQ